MTSGAVKEGKFAYLPTYVLRGRQWKEPTLMKIAFSENCDDEQRRMLLEKQIEYINTERRDQLILIKYFLS